MRNHFLFCVKELWLFDFESTRIDNGTFHGLRSLKIVYIVRCGLSEAPYFSDSRATIEILNLTSNNITYLPQEYFMGFEKLNKLVLHRNHLVYVPNFSSITRGISLIDISHNKILTLDSFSDYHFTKMISVAFSYNRIESISINPYRNLT